MARPLFLSVHTLGELLRSRQVSPVELTTIFLDRLEARGPTYNAVVTLTRDLALGQARAAETEIRAGRYRGPLHGIPYGAKDLLATGGGIPTTWGAAPFRERRFHEEATVIRRLREAGAVLAAKLAMVELAGGMGYRQLAVCLASLVHAEYGRAFGAHENMLEMPVPHPSPARHHGPKSHPARR
jgi:aspartyl-tRNA(Asn)/glutamyl-tRNA(Gln) amidotransferase subunit A